MTRHDDMMRVLLALAASVLFFALGCGAPAVGANSQNVGGACTSASDCESLCDTNRHFPGGMCTRACTADADCPSGAACIADDASTVCAMVCVSAGDCAAFGRGYTCDEDDRAGLTGKVMVCRAP